MTNNEILEDRRPDNPIEIVDFECFEFEDERNYKDKMSYFYKQELMKKIRSEKELSDDIIIDVRYSKNYASDDVKNTTPKVYVSDREIQTWHAIDLKIKTEKDVEAVEVDKPYAFVTSYKNKLKVFYFSIDNFKKLINKKNEAYSYSDYVNGQSEEYRKYNFYFAYPCQKQFHEIYVTKNDKINILNRIWSKVSIKIGK